MANNTTSDDTKDIEHLYEYGERLNEAKDKSQNEEDYKNIIASATSTNIKARQLAAQLIPRFSKFFPGLSANAIDALFDLCEAEELGIRVQAIRGLPLFCKDTPELIPKIIDILAQLLLAEENVERDAVHKALLSLLRQDVKGTCRAGYSPLLASIYMWLQLLEKGTFKESKNIGNNLLRYERPEP